MGTAARVGPRAPALQGSTGRRTIAPAARRSRSPLRDAEGPATVVAGTGRHDLIIIAQLMNDSTRIRGRAGGIRLPGRGRRDGGADALAGLGRDAAGAGRRMAAEPQDRRADHARLPVRHVAGLGAGLHLLLQRRLRPDDPRPEASLGAGPVGPRGLVGDLGRHRPPCRVGHPHRAGDLGRGLAPVPGAAGLPGGDVSHLLLQPRARRPGRHRRDALRGHGGHRADHRRAAAADAPGTGGSHDGGGEVRRGGLPDGRPDAGRESRTTSRSS